MAKILAISHDAYLYGAQRSLLDVVSGLTSAGHQVEVCVPQAGALVELLNAHRIPVHVLRFGWWIPAATGATALGWLRFIVGFPARLIRAARLIRDGNYDVVYTNTVTVIDFAVAARLRRVPHVWHIREYAVGHPQLRSPVSGPNVIAVVRALSERVIYNSRHLLARYGAPAPGKDVVVYNGLRPSGRGRLPRAAGAPVVVVTAGFMDSRKGLDVLLDALALLPEALRARMVLRVAGDIEGAYMAREITPRLRGLGGTVVLLGWVENMDEVMADADLLVSSARDEPFGRTLVEAMMAGVAVLATRSGGPEEIVVDGVTGLLVPSDDPRQLCAGLRRLLEQPELLESCGRAGRDRAFAEFSLARCVRDVEQCLLQAISQAGTSPLPRS